MPLRSLEESIRCVAGELERDFGGMLGVALTFLPTGESLFVGADELFPTASVIKIAIVSELFTRAALGWLSLDEVVRVEDNAERVAGSGVLALLTPGIWMTLRDLAMLTISVSDNTASNLCLRAVGGPGAVNARMRDEWGLEETEIHRPIRFHLQAGDPAHTATGTPRDMLNLLVRLAENRVHSAEVSAQVRACLAQVIDKSMLPRYLGVNPHAAALGNTAPPPFTIEHKTGAVTGVRNDAALIHRGSESLAICAYTRDVADGRWTPANAGAEAVARVGKLACDHFFGT